MTNATTDPVTLALDQLTSQVQAHFAAFVHATASNQLGTDAIERLPSDTVVTVSLGAEHAVEPIPATELKTFKHVYPDFVIEVFHGKLLQHWQACLGQIFAHYVELHLSGMRQFAELGKRSLRLDFRRHRSIVEGIREALCREFDFEKYAERQKVIFRVRNYTEPMGDEVAVLTQHVHIRNAIQHHHGRIQAFMLRDLGVQSLSLLDDAGMPRDVGEREKVVLTIPELDRFRRSVLLVASGLRGE